MARIETIGLNEASGKLKEIYNTLLEQRGKLAEVHTIQSLRPDSITQHMDLYMGIMFSRSELSRAEREMMAVVVSAANGCPYCQKHHAEALNHYWKDEHKIKQIIQEDAPGFLSDRELALCHYARLLTLNPHAHEKHDYTKSLRSVGLQDAAILDATLVVAYFNFVNRIVLSLGVELEDDDGQGYKY
jgi:uncharacterized peroxidase-related enzyme